MTQSWKSKRALSLALLFGGCATALGGCATTLDVRSDAGQGQYAEGVVQVLPFTQYEVSAVWRLASCEPGADNLALSVSAVPGAQDDPTQRYLIDATSLQRPLTTSSFDVTYHEGSNTIQSINAEVEDRTPEFVANVVTTVAKLAMAASGGPRAGLFTATPGGPGRSACTPEGEKALRRVEELEVAVDAATSEVDSASDQVAKLAAVVAKLGSGVDPTTAARFAAALERLDSLVETQAGLSEQLASALEDVTATVKVRWPEDGATFERAEPLRVPAKAIRDWFGAAGERGPWPESYLALRPSAGAMPIAPGQAPPTRVSGIPYRVAVRGRLLSCDRLCEDGAARQKVVVEGTVAQLGGVKVIPVRNPPLGSTTFAASFNPDGTLISAGFKQRRAPLETASAIAADATTELAPLFDPVERLKRETEYLKAVQERRDASAALEPAAADPTAGLTAETVLLQAQISNLEARLKLQELQLQSKQP